LFSSTIVIINKFVSNNKSDTCLKIDTEFKNIPINFIKIDVEGAENSVPDGANSILTSQKNIKIAICTYHNKNDEQILQAKLKNYQFRCSTTDKYMLFVNDTLNPPYFRKGLLQAKKN